MLAAYYDRSENTEELFQNLAISKDGSYKENLNQYDVIKIFLPVFGKMTKNLLIFYYWRVIQILLLSPSNLPYYYLNSNKIESKTAPEEKNYPIFVALERGLNVSPKRTFNPQ